MVYKVLKRKYPFNKIPLNEYWNVVTGIRIAKTCELEKIEHFLLFDVGYHPNQVERIMFDIRKKYMLRKTDARDLLNDLTKLGWVKKDNFKVLLVRDSLVDPSSSNLQCEGEYGTVVSGTIQNLPK